MDAEKNVVEAARRVIDWAGRGWPTVFDPLREAIAAYDAAPAPSEDRVREAAEAAIIAWSGREADPKGWPEDTRNVITALRPYVTPAPALPAGTVAVSVETLKTWRARAIERQRVLREGHGLRCELPTVAEIDALLPPPPRPEPPKDLELKWHNAGCLLANKRGYSSFNAPGAQDFVNGYVAALRDLRKP